MNRSSLSELDAQGSAETDLRYSERKDDLFIGCAGNGLVVYSRIIGARNAEKREIRAVFVLSTLRPY